MQNKFKRLAEFHKVLGNPIRIAIIMLIGSKSATAKAIREQLNISDKVLAQHLARLRRLNFIQTDRKGPAAIYRLTDTSLLSLVQTSQKTFQKLVKEMGRDLA